MASFLAIRVYQVNIATRVTATQTDISNLQSVLHVFKIDNGRFPTTAEGLQAFITRPSSATCPASNWPYVERIINDPWGHPYIYRCPGKNGAVYDLLSAGPDGKEGTADDISLSFDVSAR